MNTLDLLLGMDEAKLKKPVKEVEIKRLSELTGQKTIFRIEAISPAKMEEIQDFAIDMKTKNINVGEIQILTVIEGIKDPNVKSKELMEKFQVYTPKDLIRKILLPGEILTLYNMIGELSGFDGGAVEEVKNS